jgi:hypothetical protein
MWQQFQNFLPFKTQSEDSRERAAILDHTARDDLSLPRTSRLPSFVTQHHTQARDSNAAQGNTQHMEATSKNLFRKEFQGSSETRRPSLPAPRIQSSGAIVTSLPWIELTGGFAQVLRTHKMRKRGLISCFIGWPPLILQVSLSRASIRRPPQEVQNLGGYSV